MRESVYRNYGAALFDLVGKEGSGSYLEALQDIEKQFSLEPRLQELLCSYSLSQKEQMAILENVFSSYRLPHLVPFLKVLLTHRRFSHFSEVVSCFAALANEANQIAVGRLYSARKMSEEDRKKIEAIFAKKLGREVHLTNVVQPALLGGVKVFLEGKVYDGTLRAKLLGLEKELLHEGGNA